VKIRGFRIELGEIRSTVLLKHDVIKEVSGFIAKRTHTGVNTWCASIVSESNNKCSFDKRIRTFQKMPEYHDPCIQC